jgi:hypothetical protein
VAVHPSPNRTICMKQEHVCPDFPDLAFLSRSAFHEFI